MAENCWNIIGVRGDRSCPELDRYIHCQSCPVYADGAKALLDGEAADEYLAQWTTQVSANPSKAIEKGKAFVVFRVANEWLALPAASVAEVLPALKIHSLPHEGRSRRLGITNVHGELLVCVSLASVLDINETRPSAAASAKPPLCLVIRSEAMRAVCPVDDVTGIALVPEQQLQELPSTVAKAGSHYSTKVLLWDGHSVGILDESLLFSALKRMVA